jgi:hypothetical protein
MNPTPSSARRPQQPMAALIARSSLGTRDATRARARVRVDVAQRIVDIAARRPAAVRSGPARAAATTRAAGSGRNVTPREPQQH